jgi:hypothetical protein
MVGPDGRAERIDALRGLMERLCSPDLTLAEAKPLRARLSRLLERTDPEGELDWTASSPLVAPSRPGLNEC